MFTQLHLKHPHVKINNEVVEPSNDMLHKYKGTKHFIAAHLFFLFIFFQAYNEKVYSMYNIRQ